MNFVRRQTAAADVEMHFMQRSSYSYSEMKEN
jgi:hypothetical protein